MINPLILPPRKDKLIDNENKSALALVYINSQACFCASVLPAAQPLFKAALLACDGGHQPLVPSEKWASAGSGKPPREREQERNERESPSGLCCCRLAYGAQFGIQSDHS